MPSPALGCTESFALILRPLPSPSSAAMNRFVNQKPAPWITSIWMAGYGTRSVPATRAASRRIALRRSKRKEKKFVRRRLRRWPRLLVSRGLSLRALPRPFSGYLERSSERRTGVLRMDLAGSRGPENPDAWPSGRGPAVYPITSVELSCAEFCCQHDLRRQFVCKSSSQTTR